MPMLASLYFSFTDYSSLDPLSKARNVGLQNFERMFTGDTQYWKAVGATLYFVLFAIPLRLVFALALAMLLNVGRTGVSFYRAAFYAPSIVGGSIAVAVMWRQVFGTEGLVNGALAFLGVPPRTWLGDPDTAIWTLIILAIWQFGSPMLIFLAGLKQIPAEYYEAASIDGAGGIRKFLRITVPLLTPVIFFNLIMQMISGLMVFTQAFIITGGAPLDTTLFYALYIYRRAFENFQMGYASAMAWVLLLIIALCAAIVFKSSSQWVYYENKEE
ncbi:MAG: sugar ABC transporter permease [Anaerolineae bacterium]|nr:sugar ABC transporter permease [Anaerolineae bacterium]